MSGGGDVKDENFPIFWCSQDGWRCEEILWLLECSGGIVVPLELVRLPEKFEEGQVSITESAYEPTQGGHARS